MNRLNLILVALVAIVVSSCSEKEHASALKPNIVYILADDLGANELGCFGQEVIETPNIDRLANEGMIFNRHYAGSSVCAPSRAVLMTGKHSGHATVRDNKWLLFEGNVPIADSDVTLAEVMRSAGYKTGAFGKWGIGFPGSEGDPMNQGFDEFFGYNCQRQAHTYYPDHLWHNTESVVLKGNLSEPYTDYTADIIHSKVLEFIDTNKDEPFFLYYPSTLPHGPWQVPDDELLEYYSNKMGLPKGDFKSKEFGPVIHAAMTARLDRHVGEVVGKLKELNLLDNTLIIFVSDNGGALSPKDDKELNTHGNLRSRKGSFYEGGIKAPMIAYWQGKIIAGSTSEHLSSFYDVLPTCAEIVGVPAPEKHDGISFLPTLLGNEDQQKEHEYLYWERNRQQAILKGDIKAIISYDAKTGTRKSMEIYDLSKDPQEQHNLVDTSPELVKEFLDLAKSSRTRSFNYPLTRKAAVK